MPRRELIPIFSNEAVAITGTIMSDVIVLSKFGPNARFWLDLSASGAGRTSFRQQVGNTDDDTFYTPVNATVLVASFLGGAGNASRDRLAMPNFGTQFLKIYGVEQNASHTVINVNLIVAME